MIFLLYAYVVIGIINLIFSIIMIRREEKLTLHELFLILSFIFIPVWDICGIIFIGKEVFKKDVTLWRKKHT